jgi:uncharacterized protein (DUF1697 family)
MSVFIALLRAVNVGGTGKLPMKDLKAACEAAGLVKVQTYIASGNLVFESPLSSGQVKELIATILAEQFGLTKNHTIIRTPEQLAAAIEAGPFADSVAVKPAGVMLQFLEAPPSDPAACGETLAKWGPERLHLAGEHLYIDYSTGPGAADTKLTPAFLERILKVPGTARNWNTVQKLLEMAKR